jgi:hypothetical protein
VCTEALRGVIVLVFASMAFVPVGVAAARRDSEQEDRSAREGSVVYPRTGLIRSHNGVH